MQAHTEGSNPYPWDWSTLPVVPFTLSPARKPSTLDPEVSPDPARRVVIAGENDYLTKHVARELTHHGYSPVVLISHGESWTGPGRSIRWRGQSSHEGVVAALEGAMAIVNLTGAPANPTLPSNRSLARHRWRIAMTQALGDATRLVYRMPPVWVEASDLAIYGDTGDRICDEAAFVPRGQPEELIVSGEETFGHAVRPGMRWAVLRTGLILSRDGGVVPSLLSSKARRSMAPSGPGARWVSWLHADDFASLIRESIENVRIEGIYNATGLQPVTVAEFEASLQRMAESVPDRRGPDRRPAHVPARHGWLSKSPRALPVRMHRLGFRFTFHDLEAALADIAPVPAPSLQSKPTGAVRHPARAA